MSNGIVYAMPSAPVYVAASPSGVPAVMVPYPANIGVPSGDPAGVPGAIPTGVPVYPPAGIPGGAPADLPPAYQPPSPAPEQSKGTPILFLLLLAGAIYFVAK
jgi:hypothetical protein